MKLVPVLGAVLALAACGDDAQETTPDAAGVVSGRDFTLRIENVAPWTVIKGGAQRATTEHVEQALGPGDAYEIRFTAANHHAISFAAMLVESNDWFFAPGPAGIPLFVDGAPLSGDVTRYVRLWDAGTEYDQEPGVGDATGALQAARNTGEPDPDHNVRELPAIVKLDDGHAFVRPEVASMIRVTLVPGPDATMLRIENVSNARTLRTTAGRMAIHVSPTVWALHRKPAPLFDPGKPVRDNGLEALAEDGAVDPVATSIGFSRGYATPLSPGIALVHKEASPLFTLGDPDRGLGLEQLAEDGNVGPLFETLSRTMQTVAFETPVDGEQGAAAPGQAYEVTLHGTPGDSVSFATMFGMSNDWFFASVPEGIPLYDRDIPRSSDVTSDVRLYDLGTEGDEELDVGPNTGTQQAAPNSGRDDRIDAVREVTIDRYNVPEVLHLHVTLRPN